MPVEEFLLNKQGREVPETMSILKSYKRTFIDVLREKPFQYSEGTATEIAMMCLDPTVDIEESPATGDMCKLCVFTNKYREKISGILYMLSSDTSHKNVTKAYCTSSGMQVKSLDIPGVNVEVTGHINKEAIPLLQQSG